MASEGKTDLKELIKSMSPTLSDQMFVFGHVPAKTDQNAKNVLQLFGNMPVQMLFREDEGWSVILKEEVAKEIQLEYIFPCKKVTLNVHSSLEAVGFMAAITTKLAQLGAGVNPVSGFYHDHIFVPTGTEDLVMEALKELSAEQ